NVSRPVKEVMCCYVNIGGTSVFVLLDSGSTTDSFSPSFVMLAGVLVSELETPIPLQLGCVGSRSTIQFGTTTDITFIHNTIKHYFDIVNIDQYDAVLGTVFMHRMGVLLDFKHGVLKSGSTPVSLFKGGEGPQGNRHGWRFDTSITFQSTRELSPEPKLGSGKQLPPLREINHKIPLVDENKRYSYHLPWCTEALKPQLRAKINRYLWAGWWEEATVPQAAPMLTLLKP
ncbi:hypothetical protein JAAARDRAFT_91806, partial [Jaapia argillacea MUCL 33604]